MMKREAGLAVAGLALGALWAPAAQAKVTEIFTISDFQPVSGGVNFTVIQSVTGSFTEGTTAADDTSNVTVVETGQGQTVAYTLTGPENGPEWTVTSQYFSPLTASFRINPFGPGPVSTGVGVSLTTSQLMPAASEITQTMKRQKASSPRTVSTGNRIAGCRGPA